MVADAILLDTNVASFFLPFEGRPQRSLYEPLLSGKRWVLSFQSVGELLRLPERNGWNQDRRRRLDCFLARFVVVPADAELAATRARVGVQAERLGCPLETADAWILATALRLDLPLVTHDRDLFVLERLGGRVITALPQSVPPSPRKNGAGVTGAARR